MPEVSFPSSSLGSLVRLPYLWTFAVVFVLKDAWCLLPTMCTMALLPIVVKVIILLHTMLNAFRESPFACLTHLYSSLVNLLGLNLHFTGIFLASSNRQHNCNVLKNSTITSSMWHTQRAFTNHRQPLINLVLPRSLAHISVLLLCVYYSCDKNSLI